MKKLLLLVFILGLLSCNKEDNPSYDNSIYTAHGIDFQIVQCEGTTVYIEHSDPGEHNFKIHFEVDGKIVSFLLIGNSFDIGKEFSYVRIANVTDVLV